MWWYERAAFDSTYAASIEKSRYQLWLRVTKCSRARGDTVTGSYGQADKVFADLRAVGIDLDDVFQVLEDEGVDKFEASWKELLESVDKSLTAAASGSGSPTDAA